MTKYYIEEQNINVATFEVEAANPEDAELKHEEGQSVLIDQYDDVSVDVWEAVD